MSDFHSTNPCDIVKTLHKQGRIDRAAFLGDYDEPSILEEILDLKIDKMVLAGNHDYSFVADEEIYSPKLFRTFDEYVELWEKHKKAKKFVQDSEKTEKGLKKGLKVVRRHQGKKVCYVHGSLADEDLDIGEQWGRLIDDYGLLPSKITENFQKMQEQDYWILFRGHDHMRTAFKNSKDNTYYGIYETMEETKFRLDKKYRYVISIPPHYLGYATLFDDEKMEVDLSFL